MIMTSIRFEYGVWPLWRIDKSLRYVWKSLVHKKKPADPVDRMHFNKMFSYLRQGSWQRQPSLISKSLLLACVGDVMPVGENSRHYISKDLLRVLSQADLRLINLETPIYHHATLSRFETLLFNASSDILAPWNEIAKNNIFSLCNNHALDMGLDGLQTTRDLILQNQHNICIGGVAAEDQYAVIDLQGIRLGCFGFTYAINPWNNDYHSHIDDVRILKIDFCHPTQQPNWQEISTVIKQIRQQGVDLVIAMAHWGYEYEYWPEQAQRKAAYRLIELGVDVIIGSSPHVLQPLEIVSVNGWDSQCPIQLSRKECALSTPGIIAYSLGNFTTKLATTACKTGVIMNLKLNVHQHGFDIQSINLSPTVTRSKYYSGKKSSRVFPLDRNMPGHVKFFTHCHRAFSPFIK